MNRRDFLNKGLGLGAGLLLNSTASNAMGSMMFSNNNSLALPKIPLQDYQLLPVDDGQLIDGKQVFKLNLQQGETQFFPGVQTQTIGINQSFLAPILRFKKGQQVKMEVTNHLNETAALHWHGMILPASQDGGPHQAIEPNQTWVAQWKILNEPSTLFYHSHTHNQTGQQVWRGLAGQIQIIDEQQDASLGIPHQYGVDDYPVIMTDGEFYYQPTGMNKMKGMHGDVMLVNGVAHSILKPKKTLIRLRLHNASNARFYHLVFSDNRPFKLIATDGGLLEAPVSLNEIKLAPAERAEILVDLSDKHPVSLRTLKGYGNLSMGMMGGMMGNMMGGQKNGLDQNFDILHIDPTQAESVAGFKTQSLIQLPNYLKMPVAKTRPMELQMQMGPAMMFGSGGFSINGASMQMNVINEVLKANTYEIWELSNPSMMHHPFHVHNTQFKVLDRNGQAPNPWESGLKDTITVYKNDRVRILFPTGPYQDDKIPYMYHCHILEHEDAGMMGQFTTI